MLLPLNRDQRYAYTVAVAAHRRTDPICGRIGAACILVGSKTHCALSPGGGPPARKRSPRGTRGILAAQTQTRTQTHGRKRAHTQDQERPKAPGSALARLRLPPGSPSPQPSVCRAVLKSRVSLFLITLAAIHLRSRQARVGKNKTESNGQKEGSSETNTNGKKSTAAIWERSPYPPSFPVQSWRADLRCAA